MTHEIVPAQGAPRSRPPGRGRSGRALALGFGLTVALAFPVAAGSSPAASSTMVSPSASAAATSEVEEERAYHWRIKDIRCLSHPAGRPGHGRTSLSGLMKEFGQFGVQQLRMTFVGQHHDGTAWADVPGLVRVVTSEVFPDDEETHVFGFFTKSFAFDESTHGQRIRERVIFEWLDAEGSQLHRQTLKTPTCLG